uniref:Ribonuclease H-like domain-containing protein n=1 Tax=Tanacetum cinerariifolium TaxID=118510 RepID=A0A6L2KH64_TANCI|nr:ribonuclease H-like domain-containing protein [Tanacetum cinerariifolium]
MGSGVDSDASKVRMGKGVGSRKHKVHADGTLSRYKARLVANGSSQQIGIDVDETFSLVVKPTTIRTILSLVVSRKWPIHQLDVKNAFLNDGLLETVYMHHPPSTEAEYRGVANVVAEIAWLCNPLCELHSSLSSATLVYGYKVSAIYMYVNPVQHQRTKHIKIDIHFVRDMVTAGQVRVPHVPSRYQHADIFTKGLPWALFEEFRSSLSVSSSSAPTARCINLYI